MEKCEVTLCKNPGVEEENDRLTQLPDNVLLSIMCLLTTKEAAQLSVVSHKWKQLWAYYPGILHFEDHPMTTYELHKLVRNVVMSKDIEALVSRDTRNFVRWITHVVEQHLGPSLQEFKVAFDLDNTYQSDIDNWVVFALSKGVTSLELEFNVIGVMDQFESNYYNMPLKCCIALKPPHRLRTLVLSHMGITAQVLECFLQSCVCLEKLRMSNVSSLGCIRTTPSSPLALKHFDVSDSQVEIIDILAPKLSTFRYHGCDIELNIRNALSLSEVTLRSVNEQPTHVLKSLSECFPQLEYLHITSYMRRWGQTNLVLPPVSNLTNLKHLKLSIEPYSYQSLIGWITLIQASPLLQKLTLELDVSKADREMALEMHTSPPKPLKSLKMLEVYGFMGLRIDIELVTYVIENAVALEEVFIDLKGYSIPEASLQKKRAKAEFKEKLPIGAKLVINNRYQVHNFMYSYPLLETTNWFNKPEEGMLGRISKIRDCGF